MTTDQRPPDATDPWVPPDATSTGGAAAGVVVVVDHFSWLSPAIGGAMIAATGLTGVVSAITIGSPGLLGTCVEAVIAVLALYVGFTGRRRVEVHHTTRRVVARQGPGPLVFRQEMAVGDQSRLTVRASTGEVYVDGRALTLPGAAFPTRLSRAARVASRIGSLVGAPVEVDRLGHDGEIDLLAGEQADAPSGRRAWGHLAAAVVLFPLIVVPPLGWISALFATLAAAEDRETGGSTLLLLAALPIAALGFASPLAWLTLLLPGSG